MSDDFKIILDEKDVKIPRTAKEVQDAKRREERMRGTQTRAAIIVSGVFLCAGVLIVAAAVGHIVGLPQILTVILALSVTAAFAYLKRKQLFAKEADTEAPDR